jgi:fluoride exporter
VKPCCRAAAAPVPGASAPRASRTAIAGARRQGAPQRRCTRVSGAVIAPRLPGVIANAPDGRRSRSAEAQDLPRLVRALRDRFSVAQLRVAAILGGGAVGALTRAGVGRAFPVRPGAWPWATFTVNLAGAFVLAWITTRLAEMVAPTRYWRLLIGTGFCGALTTFSTFQVETIRLARDGHAALGFAYAAVSMTLGMAAAIGATVLARRQRYG